MANVENDRAADDDVMPHALETLANAIILAAVEDYRSADKQLAKNPDNKQAEKTQREVIRFIRSDWFGVLSDAEPENIIRLLETEG